jgi:hypothetical protein
VVIISHRQYKDHHDEDQPLECELQGEDLNGTAYKMVRVRGHSTSWARKNKVESGLDTIFAPDGADIDDNAGELIIPSGANIKVNSYSTISFVQVAWVLMHHGLIFPRFSADRSSARC